MFVTLIPLFLVANISVHESEWKYGPEVIYDVKVDSMSQSRQLPSHISELNWTTKLRCREKSRLVLSCHIYPLEAAQIPKKFNVDFSSKGPFELHFGHRGLEKIITSSSLEPAVLDTARSVFDQFNLGADLSTIPHDIFDVMENSTTGECKTGYVLSSSYVDNVDISISSSEESNEEDTNNCEIVIVPGMQSPNGEAKEIIKNRRLDDCVRQYRHAFAIMQGASADFLGSPDDGIFIATQFKSSKSHMTITDNSFISYTEKVFTVRDNVNPDVATLSEVITVKLEKIVEAIGPMPSIQHPLAVSIFPERWC